MPTPDHRAELLHAMRGGSEAFRLLARLLASGLDVAAFARVAYPVPGGRQTVYRALNLARDAGYGPEIDAVPKGHARANGLALAWTARRGRVAVDVVSVPDELLDAETGEPRAA